MRNKEPQIISARFQSRCPETGKLIQPGQKCVWYPAAKKVYHMDSKAARQYQEMRFAESWGMGDSNW